VDLLLLCDVLKIQVIPILTCQKWIVNIFFIIFYLVIEVVI